MLGYEDNELPNELSIWENLTEPEDAEKSWKMNQEMINKQHDRFEMEFKMKHKDGHWVDILSRADAVFDDSGKAIRIVGTHVDITERKQAEEELNKHREHLEELVLERTNELNDNIKELERFNKLFIDREIRIKELKDKVKELEEK